MRVEVTPGDTVTLLRTRARVLRAERRVWEAVCGVARRALVGMSGACLEGRRRVAHRRVRRRASDKGYVERRMICATMNNTMALFWVGSVYVYDNTTAVQILIIFMSSVPFYKSFRN